MDRKNEVMDYLYLNGNLVISTEINIICNRLAGQDPAYLEPFYRFGTGNYHLYVDELVRVSRRSSKLHIFLSIREYYPAPLWVDDVVSLFWADIDNYYRRVEGNPIDEDENE